MTRRSCMRVPGARRWRTFWCDDRGSSLMEMAMAGPLFVMLLLGIAEFGRAVWLYDTVSHAAREATRFAIVRGGESGRAANATTIQTFVRQIPGLAQAQVTTTWQPNNQPGSVVSVNVQVPFAPALPLLPALTVSSTSQLVISF
jgi:Flp pilus assembly protein TadG